MSTRLAALLLLASACGPVTVTTELSGDGTVNAAAMMAAPLTMLPQIASLTGLDLDTNRDLKAAGVVKASLTSMKVQQATIAITSPVNQDFSFLDTVQLVARTGENEALVAQKKAVSSAAPKGPKPILTLDLVDVQLVEFARASTLTVVMRGTGRQPTSDVRVHVTLKVAFEASSP